MSILYLKITNKYIFYIPIFFVFLIKPQSTYSEIYNTFSFLEKEISWLAYQQYLKIAGKIY